MPRAVAIDFETADKRPDSAVSVGLVWLGGPHDGHRFYSLVRPARACERFTKLHGIDLASQRSAPSFADVWQKIVLYLEPRPSFIAHNAAFDRAVLRAMAEHNNLDLPHHRFSCTLRAARERFPGLPCDLHSTARRLGIEAGTAHHALCDAVMTAKIARVLLSHLA